MTEKIYLDTLKSVLGRSIFHYSTITIHGEICCEGLWKFIYCENFIVECVTLIKGIIVSLYKEKFSLSGTSLSINTKVYIFLFKIPFLWWQQACV